MFRLYKGPQHATQADATGRTGIIWHLLDRQARPVRKTVSDPVCDCFCARRHLQVTRVLLGAKAVLSNGWALGRVGCATIALAASQYKARLAPRTPARHALFSPRFSALS